MFSPFPFSTPHPRYLSQNSEQAMGRKSGVRFPAAEGNSYFAIASVTVLGHNLAPIQ
jgi:hypothetical protein